MAILFLAPFRSMAEIAIKVAKETGIPLIVEITDDQMAKSVVLKHQGVEVVVSRGGVAEEVKSIDGITVTEVTMSIEDLLSILNKLTQQGYQRIGIVSRANICGGTMGDYQISQTKIYIRSCKNEEEISKTVIQLYQEGVQAIIGCRAAYETAKGCGIAAEYLNSSKLSIRYAIEEAVKIVKAKEKEKIQAAQLTAIIDNIEEGVIAVTGDKHVSFYNKRARRICAPDGKEFDISFIDTFLQNRNQEKILTINGNGVLARVIPLEFDNKIKGDVITFQEVSNIQDSERRIRFSSYKKGLYAKKTFEDIIGQTEIMKKLIQKAKDYAQYDSNLLIYGETGTGKEVLAQSIHNHSKWKKGPFVSVNTASIPPNLLESELFGYVEGAFTGARKGGKLGLFELAHGGTIFLDEIGELSPDIQSRLLRVLQEKEIMRIGDDKIIPVNVRVICATNRDLLAMVKEGSFRADLYYRINVLGLRIPPLRERVEDIPLLFNYYVQQLAKKVGKNIEIHPGVIKMLMSYPWPGNVRELRNVSEIVVYTGGELIKPDDIEEILQEKEMQVNPGKYITIPEKGTLKDMESEIIKHLLSKYSIEEVCQQLGISRVTLWRKSKSAFQ